MAGTITVPANERNAAWDDVIRKTRSARATTRKVSAFVDTNILVCQLTGDPPGIAVRVTKYLANEYEVLLVDLVMAETVYVLESFYKHHVGKSRRRCDLCWRCRP
ncbi:MAG: hypothetical protein ABI706_12235 [Ilumatobacteraceae bacterium]